MTPSKKIADVSDFCEQARPNDIRRLYGVFVAGKTENY